MTSYYTNYYTSSNTVGTWTMSSLNTLQWNGTAYIPPQPCQCTTSPVDCAAHHV